MKNLIMSILVTLVAISSVQAAKMNHSGMNHSEMNSSTMQHDMSTVASEKIQGKAVLQKLATMPVSGQAREGGYDDRYVMESTDVADVLQMRCAQASRGLVMIDNVEWSRCGGKSDGAAADISAAKISQSASKMNEHAGHNM